MFVMDQVTNVQFARIIFIAPQFVTGQVGTTVMIQPHEIVKNNKENANQDQKKKKERSFPFNFLQFEFCHLMARYSFVSRLSGYN